MWKTCENFTCFFTWACVKSSVKSPCENQVKWDGPFHIMDDVKKLCEIGNSHHALYRLGLMIWCEKLCETCEKTMWNKKIHIMHCKTRLNDVMWKTMWNLFWLTCHTSIFRKTLGWSLLSHTAILHSWCSFSLSCTSFLKSWICKTLSVTI